MSFAFGYDTETTSTEVETTGVVQLAGVAKFDDGVEEVMFNQLCKPRVDISDGAFEVHGISNDMVKDAELDHLAMRRLYRYVHHYKDEIIIVGHNIITFDLPILFTLGGPQFPVRWIDSLVCATRIYPDAESHKLSELFEWMELGSAENAHDALADIQMVFKIIEHFRKGLKKSWDEMAEWCMTPRLLRRAHFGKHQGKLWGKPAPGEPWIKNKYIPTQYVRYITEKWDHPSPDMVETIRHHYHMRFKNQRMVI